MTVKIKDVFAIPESEPGEKKLWSKVGVAFINKDESINVILDALPTTGKLNIRDRRQNNQKQQKEIL